MGSRARWRWSGDRALLRDIAQDDIAARNAWARALYQRLAGRRFDEVEDVVPGAASVLILLRPGAEPSAALLEALDRDLSDAGRPREARRHEIGVCYGGGAGPDLSELARLHGLREREIVELHCSPTYTVGFLGFAPGFAYLIGLPAALETPRLATPRTRVPAGSVAIGGSFTAVYPRSTPGGWRLVGLTDVALFDVSAPSPARLAPGDQVKFVPQ
jgi:KipI family sensor histidine kinase inhibitor